MTKVDTERIEQAAREIIAAIGEDPTREGLLDTPRRVAQAWREFIEYDPGNVGTTFNSISTDQMIVVSGIRIWSLCEHHLLPFWADVAIGYIPGDRILGLSKFARIAQAISHRLQLQERLTSQIADEITRCSGTRDVAVVAKGEHLCMLMRGAKSSALMSTSVMRGAFREDSKARAEFLSLVQ